MSNRLVVYARNNAEKLRLFGYFIIVVVLSLPLSQMLGAAWQRASVARALVRLPVLAGISFEDLTVLLFGVYVGILLLMTIDPKKRWQSALLWIGTLLGLLGLSAMGLFLPNINLIDSSGWLAIGAVGATVLGGGRETLQLANVRSVNTLEFRGASRWFYRGIAAIVIIALLEYHIQYPDIITVTSTEVQVETVQQFEVQFTTQNLPIHLVTTGGFLFTMRRFVQYDAEKDFFVLGPRSSGKSLFLVGSYFAALNKTNGSDAIPLNPSEDLMTAVDNLDQSQSGWALASTAAGETHEYSFQFVRGSVFPVNVKVSSIDYAGEYLSRLPDELLGTIPELEAEDNIEETDVDETLQRLAIGVESANILILIIDIKRFVNQEPMEISEYFSILQATNKKQVLLVGTKADYLLEDYREEVGLDPSRYFEDFRNYVNERLRSNKQVESLIQEAGGADIHPVYYQTEENDIGDRVPLRNENGEVMTVGYDELLDKLSGW